MNKYGSYVQKLMTLILDKEQEEFVKKLAWNELNRLHIDVNEFLLKHSEDDSEQRKETEKILLQENTNGKNSK